MLTPRWLYTFLLLLLAPGAQSQLPASAPFKTLTVANGLPQSFISGLVQDKQGFIWIGTRDGLARYDGIEYRIFNHIPTDTNSLAANVITNLYFDRQDRLWIIYETGETDVLNTATEKLLHFSQLPGCTAITNVVKGHFSSAQSIATDGNGNTWLLGKSGGVFIYEAMRRRLQFYSDTALGLADNRITGICAAGDNILLITDTALVTMNAARRILSVVPYTFEYPHLFNRTHPWKDTRPIIRPNGDIAILDENRFIVYQHARHSFTVFSLPWRKMYTGPSMTIDDKENIYFDFIGVIYVLTTDNRLLPWQPQRPLPYPNSVSMLFDRSGILWVGGNGSGITLYDLRLPHINGISYTHNFFTDVLQNHGGIPASDLQSCFIARASQFMVRHTIAGDGTIWFSMSGNDTVPSSQLCYAVNGRLHTIEFPHVLPDGARHTGIAALALSKSGKLWGVDSRYGLVAFSLDDKSATIYPPFHPPGGTNDMLIDGENIFWITSISYGLFCYDLSTGRLRRFEQKDKPGYLPPGQLLNMEKDPADSSIIWIGSMGGGLIRFNRTDGSARCFTTNDGLPNNTVYAIMADSRGTLWCSSNKGIFTFDTRTSEIRSFTVKDGLLNDEFNRFHFIRLPNGRMAFGGGDSYAVFDPLAVTEDDYTPVVALTGLNINNEPADYGQPGSPFTQSLNSLEKITLPYNRNFLSFRFAALEYNIPGKMQYRYRLSGIDDKWVYAKTGNTATYTSVPPGRYELQVNATNTSGKWSPHIKKVILVITPPFWKTWWFISLVVLAAGLLVFMIMRARMKSMRKKEKLRLQFEREVMELEAQALRSQMNPHFIFNCLNSIKLLIQEDKKQEAIVYLTTFSKLIRSQLSNSQKEISLAEELKTCRLYLQMEALRFGPGLVFEFAIDESADIYALMVPPLIIQPFIENAVWHGILPRETGGKVTIQVADKGSTIACIIDDDGIGREQSGKNKSAMAPAHPSKGMQLTQSRMNLYNLLYPRGGHITITDKKNKQGRAAGTTVTISFKKEI